MVSFRSKASRIARRKGLAVLGQTYCNPAFNNLLQTQSTRHLSLAYALHESPKSEPSNSDRAIIIMHGLFGSKQNNRSISKYGSLDALVACIILILE